MSGPRWKIPSAEPENKEAELDLPIPDPNVPPGTSLAPDIAPQVGKKTVYEIVLDRILAKIESGVIPWQRPWSGGMPANFISTHPYRGINLMLLADMGSTPWWLTFQQAHELGGHVKAGEHGQVITFWKMLSIGQNAPTAGETNEKPSAKRKGARAKPKVDEDTVEHIPMLRYYRVWNLDQCEIPEERLKPLLERREKPPLVFTPIEQCEHIVTGMPNPPTLVSQEMRAFYRPRQDELNMPPKERFHTVEEYYSTLFHELTHSTGHASRLDRPTLTQMCPFGSTNYSQEELVAEMGAAFLCGLSGIENRTVDNSASYLANWMQRLKDDKRLLIRAAGQAQKAVDYITGAKAHPTGSKEE